jgi:hypothetical protein
VYFHETAGSVNTFLLLLSTHTSIRILMSREMRGSMHVEFKVEVRRCHLSRELEGSSTLFAVAGKRTGLHDTLKP